MTGGSGEQDLEVAKAGIAAFVAGLSETTEDAQLKPIDASMEESKTRATETVEPMPR